MVAAAPGPDPTRATPTRPIRNPRPWSARVHAAPATCTQHGRILITFLPTIIRRPLQCGVDTWRSRPPARRRRRQCRTCPTWSPPLRHWAAVHQVLRSCPAPPSDWSVQPLHPHWIARRPEASTCSCRPLIRRLTSTWQRRLHRPPTRISPIRSTRSAVPAPAFRPEHRWLARRPSVT